MKKKAKIEVEPLKVEDRVEFLDGSLGIICEIEGDIAIVSFGPSNHYCKKGDRVFRKLYRINLNSLKKR